MAQTLRDGPLATPPDLHARLDAKSQPPRVIEKLQKNRARRSKPILSLGGLARSSQLHRIPNGRRIFMPARMYRLPPCQCASSAHQHAHQVPIKMRTICPQSASRTRTEMGALPPALPITDHRPPFTGHRSPKTDHRPPAINPRLPFHSRCSIETSSAE